MFTILIIGRTIENAMEQLEKYLSEYAPSEVHIKYRDENRVILMNGAEIKAIRLSDNLRAPLGDFLMIDSTIDLSKCWMPYPEFFARHSPLPIGSRVVYF